MFRPDIHTLRLFQLVVQHRSVLLAARAAHMVPSAVSRRISDLEAQLGTTLLVRRRGAGVVPTPAGESLVRHVVTALDLLDRIPAQMGAWSSPDRGELRLASMTTAIVGGLLADLDAFSLERPAVTIRVLERQSLPAIDAVVAGDAEAAIVGHYMPQGDLCVTPWRDVPLALAVPLGHPMCARRSVRFEEALAYPLITLSERSAIHGWMHDAAARLGRTPAVADQAITYEAMRALVAAGRGIAVMPEPNVVPFRSTMGLACVVLEDAWARLPLYVVTRRRSSCTPLVRAFTDWLVARELVRGGSPVANE